MKTTMLLFLSFYSMFSLAADSALQVSGHAPWKFEQFARDSFESKFTGGAVAAFLRPSPLSEEGNITVLVREITGAAPSGRDLAQWQTHVFGDRRKELIFLRERVIKVQGEWRYFAEVQARTSSESLLNSAVVAISSGGKTYLLSFEQHQVVYNRDIRSVLDLFRKVRI